MELHIGCIPGDGIGPEIVREAKKVLDRVAEKFGHTIQYTEILLGGASIDVHGIPLTREAIDAAKKSDAVLMGSIGGDANTSPWYKLPSQKRPEAGLLAIRKELGLSDDSFLVLSVGELLPRKNQQVVIRALGILKDKNIHYILCGKGKKRDQLTMLAKKNGIENQVHFLGYRKDVADIYGQTDLLALPSRREGLGLAGLEGMYCGLPLVTSNINGIRDYMENGKTGFMYDPDDAEGFARGILKMKNSLKMRQGFGSYNRKVVIPFCIENSKQEVLKLIQEL